MQLSGELVKLFTSHKIIQGQLVEIEISNNNNLSKLCKIAIENRDFLSKYLSWIQSDSSEEDITKRLSKHVDNFWKNSQEIHSIIFTILVKNSIVGMLNVQPKNDQSIELGYWIAESYCKSGYACDAIISICKFIISNIKNIRIRIVTTSTNTASIKAALKAGFNEVHSLNPHNKIIFEYNQTIGGSSS